MFILVIIAFSFSFDSFLLLMTSWALLCTTRHTQLLILPEFAPHLMKEKIKSGHVYQACRKWSLLSNHVLLRFSEMSRLVKIRWVFIYKGESIWLGSYVIRARDILYNKKASKVFKTVFCFQFFEIHLCFFFRWQEKKYCFQAPADADWWTSPSLWNQFISGSSARWPLHCRPPACGW